LVGQADDRGLSLLSFANPALELLDSGFKSGYIATLLSAGELITRTRTLGSFSCSVAGST